MVTPLSAEERRYHLKAARLRLRRQVLGCWPLWLALIIGRMIEGHWGSPLPALLGFSGVAALLAVALLAADSYRVTAAHIIRSGS